MVKKRMMTAWGGADDAPPPLTFEPPGVWLRNFAH